MTIRSWGSKALRPTFEKLWPKIRVKQIGTVGKIQIWTIHGKVLRDYADASGKHPFLDFCQGGNWQAYSWLPPYLIVIDADATAQEINDTKLHELSEANEMEAAGDNYDIGKHPAHQFANKIEGDGRSHPDKYKALWNEQVARALKLQGKSPDKSMKKPSRLINSGGNDEDAETEDNTEPSDDAAESPSAPGQAQTGSALLQAAEQKIESQLLPKTKTDYLKIVTAGMRIGLRGGPNSIIASLAKSKDPIHDAAVGAVNLTLMMARQSKGTMPIKAMVPAATTLMIKALEFVDRTEKMKIGNDELANATKMVANTLLSRAGITPRMMQFAAQKVHSFTQDPASLEKIKRAAGAVKSPDASEPTPMSDESEEQPEEATA